MNCMCKPYHPFFFVGIIALAELGLGFRPMPVNRGEGKWTKRSVSAPNWGASFQEAIKAFQFPSPSRPLDPSKDEAIAALLDAVARAKLEETDASEDAVRDAFAKVERLLPSPENLLDDPSCASLLDGEWVLEYTVAAYGTAGEGASADPEQRGKKGAVNATGIAVDTTAADVRTTQTFDLATSRVSNEISRCVKVLPFAPALDTRLRVSGPFSRSSASGRRADVNFDSLELSAGSISLTIGWIFDLVYALKPDDKNLSWLETTHVSKNLRLGRGNKGSIFVLTRE